MSFSSERKGGVRFRLPTEPARNSPRLPGAPSASYGKQQDQILARMPDLGYASQRGGTPGPGGLAMQHFGFSHLGRWRILAVVLVAAALAFVGAGQASANQPITVCPRRCDYKTIQDA